MRELIEQSQVLLDDVHELRQLARGYGIMDYLIVNQGSDILKLPTVEMRDDSAFVGWFDENGDEVKENTKVTDDMIIRAKWSLNRYGISFDVNGGAAIAEQTVEHGERIALPSAPVREGYIFEGWYLDADGNIAATNYAVATADAVFHAKWTKDVPALDFDDGATSRFDWGDVSSPNTPDPIHDPTPTPDPVVTQQIWTVTFDAQSGVAEESSRAVTNGCAVGELPAATWDGHTFDGWWTQLSPVSSNTVITTNVTFYAHWTTNAYIVTFHANGGSGTMPSQTFTAGVSQDLTANAFTYSGYTFKGWALSSSGGVVYADGQSVSITSGVTLYAVWEPNTGSDMPTFEISQGVLTGVELNGATDVVIPSGVTRIGEFAFEGCWGMRSVTMPDSVTSIGEYAFCFCSDLTSMAIPNSVTHIGEGAFLYCEGLTSVVFDGSAPVVGDDAFEGVDSNCVVRVSRTSTGWGVGIPGVWNGIRIEYDGVVEQVLTISRAGWNLVSFNVLPDDPSPEVVFADVADGIQSVVSGTKRWTPLSGGRLAALQIGVGYWVKTSRDNVVWTISGKPDEGVAIHVNEGWNLIGYPLLDAGAPEAVLQSASNSGIVSSVVSGTRRWTPQSGGRLTEMTPGVGYWLKAAKAGTIKFDR